MTNKATDSAVNMGVAPLTNVGVALAAMAQVQAATVQMPRIAVLSGAPGLGKTQAAAYMAHPAGINAVFIQLRPFETMKSLAQLLLSELDVRPKSKWSVPEMFDQICAKLAQTGRPLLIDEFDHIAQGRCVELIRSIHDRTATPIFLIGEEQLQQKLLKEHERFHDRVLVWAQAMPCDVDDAAALAQHYVPTLAWEAGALEALVRRTAGVARRITTELERIKEECKRKNLASVTPDLVGAAKKGGH